MKNISDIIDYLSWNDNEISNIYRSGTEYIIEIKMWNADICKLKTVNCQKIIHNVCIRDDIGDIIIHNNLYKFMTISDDNEEEAIILEIEADNIEILKFYIK